MMPLQAKASDAVEEAANRVQDATSSETVQKVAGKVKAAAKAGDSAPMHGRTAVVSTSLCWGYSRCLRVYVNAMRLNDHLHPALRGNSSHTLVNDGAGHGCQLRHWLRSKSENGSSWCQRHPGGPQP